MKRLVIASVALVVLAACGGGATPAPSTTSVPAPTTSVQSEPTTTTQAAVSTSTTTGDWPETEFVINGDDDFVQHTQTALALIESEAPALYEQVYVHIDTISAVTAGSGMDVFTETFKVGEQTAYAPVWPLGDQVKWYASTMVHDSCHSRLYDEGREPGGRDAELECLADQLSFLEIVGHTAFEGYVTGIIEGVDDPGNDYWNDPNRHW